MAVRWLNWFCGTHGSWFLCAVRARLPALPARQRKSDARTGDRRYAAVPLQHRCDARGRIRRGIRGTVRTRFAFVAAA
jgi:hypothetical protein